MSDTLMCFRRKDKSGRGEETLLHRLAGAIPPFDEFTCDPMTAIDSPDGWVPVFASSLSRQQFHPVFPPLMFLPLPLF